MGGFIKGLTVIEAFDRDRDALTIAEVARTASLDRATARRCLLTLAKLGYAETDGKRFRLTPRVLRLGFAYLTAAPLPRLVQPYLERMSEKTGESCSVSILDGDEILVRRPRFATARAVGGPQRWQPAARPLRFDGPRAPRRYACR